MGTKEKDKEKDKEKEVKVYECMGAQVECTR